MTVSTRLPAVAGTFYPDTASALRGLLTPLLLAAAHQEVTIRPKALLVPHAGYVYSGAIAATALALLAPLAAVIRRVVLLGPVHRVWTPALALPNVQSFRTPLGDVPLDLDAIASLNDLAQVTPHPAAHQLEHSLEVQLPFLQSVLDHFTLIPLAVGDASPEQVAEVLDRLWGGPETLILISSDLSHYLPYQEAQHLDRSTARAIEALHSNLVGEQACGAHPLNGLLLLARRRGMTAHLLDLRNSGDTAGDKTRVVGYASFAFTEPDHA